MNGFPVTRRALLAGGAAIVARPVWALQPSNESERLYAFFEQVWQRNLARNPAMQSNLGLRAGRDSWPNISEQRAAEDADRDRENLAALRRFNRAALTPQAALSYVRAKAAELSLPGPFTFLVGENGPAAVPR